MVSSFGWETNSCRKACWISFCLQRNEIDASLLEASPKRFFGHNSHNTTSILLRKHHFWRTHNNKSCKHSWRFPQAKWDTLIQDRLYQEWWVQASSRHYFATSNWIQTDSTDGPTLPVPTDVTIHRDARETPTSSARSSLVGRSWPRLRVDEELKFLERSVLGWQLTCMMPMCSRFSTARM
jgi:hypothetical protein